MRQKLGAVLVGFVALVVLAGLSLFVVDQRQNAIVFRLGEIVDIKTEAGLYFKLPIVDNVRYFDTRILTLDTPEPERFITSEKKNVLVDLFVKWRIVDVRQYYISVGGDEMRAQTRLSQTINSSLRDEFGNRTVHDVVSGERDKIMNLMREKANEDASKIGVQVLDVRLRRVDLPQAERKRVANELRSTGSAESEKIRADADRQREVIIAEAYSEAQRIKGEGDAKASAIYARAYEQNPEFFSYYRSLEAYRASLRSRSDMLVLDPSSEFFKYLKNPGRPAR